MVPFPLIRSAFANASSSAISLSTVLTR
ncbi:hypothetical protein RJ639_035799 [Escallonia herrerae]|uniref:Uncharacterized protein n=1 Tax=Escallonia herrerae TaxID=1293975 RepID=A0AA89BIH7_9ASTE|nr:hypothetical protein RJ639_035799 [Escallonia herrerae]